MNDQTLKKKANRVLLAGILFNLTIGVLYTWSVLKTKMTAPLAGGGWEWTSRQAGQPYTFAIVFFAIGLLVGGIAQDRVGPRPVATVGGALAGAGMILSGLMGNSVIGITICFGIVTGIGIGLGYGCVTPPALKWFHPGKKGMISGLIVGGFGIAAVYLAPLTTTLLSNFSISQTFIYLGIAVAIISVLIAQLVQNPPAGYVPEERRNKNETSAKAIPSVDYTWREMVKTKRFYLLFIMYLFSASVGLMIIGNMSKIASTQIGIADPGFLALMVAFLAITNTAGRVIGGMMSDRIGRVNALFVVFAMQAVNMVGFMFYRTIPALMAGIVAAGFSYGTLLSVYPSITADQYGLKNYGTNYGVLYLSWGLAGLVTPMIADVIYDASGNFNMAYVICAILLTAIIVVNCLLKADLDSIKK